MKVVKTTKLQQRTKQDKQTVTPEGNLLLDLIEGVKVRYSTTIPDSRGTLTEIYNPIWGIHKDPLTYVYQVTIRVGQTKGWQVHKTYDDRSFVSQGTIKFVLYDDRPKSKTFKKLNEIYVSEDNRGLVIIPRGVFHALQNVGHKDAMFINCPTAIYKYTKPDKHRLPLNTKLIPYKFK